MDEVTRRLEREALESPAAGARLAQHYLRGARYEEVVELMAGAPPTGGPAALLAMAAALTSSGDDVGAYAALVNRARQLPRHGRVVLIGDFLQPVEDTHRLLRARAAQRVRGHLLRIVDPAEESLPYDGRVMFGDPETGSNMLVDWVSSSRPAYQQAWRRHGFALEDVVRNVGWTIATHHTDRPAEEALLSLYLAIADVLET